MSKIICLALLALICGCASSDSFKDLDDHLQNPYWTIIADGNTNYVPLSDSEIMVLKKLVEISK